MTAVVTPMPGVRLLTVQRLPLERRKALLRDLARGHWDMEEENVSLQLAAWAHDSLTGPALRSAWLEYRARLDIADGITEGRLHWSVVDDSLCCPDRTEAAIERACEDAEEALSLLAGGCRHGRA
jgi:hypothetical protein